MNLKSILNMTTMGALGLQMTACEQVENDGNRHDKYVQVEATHGHLIDITQNDKTHVKSGTTPGEECAVRFNDAKGAITDSGKVEKFYRVYEPGSLVPSDDSFMDVTTFIHPVAQERQEQHYVSSKGDTVYVLGASHVSIRARVKAPKL